MQFRLYYRGPLKSSGSAKDKHAIREILRPQLEVLWEQSPLRDLKSYLLSGQEEASCIRAFDENTVFAPLVQSRQFLIAAIDVTLLRPEEPGDLVVNGGDIDNRLKTLFDALRMPQVKDEIPRTFGKYTINNPYFCVLEDDKLITELSVTTDRLLDVGADQNEVVAIIKVTIKATRSTWKNSGIV